MDEPASALDPISTLKIEDLIHELRERYTIVIVTHNMQQASRVSQMTAFFTLGEDRAGYLVEYSADGADLHQSQGTADRGLRLGEVRLMATDRDDIQAQVERDARRPSRRENAERDARHGVVRCTQPAARASTARSARSRTRCCAWAASSPTQIEAAMTALDGARRGWRNGRDRRRRPDQRGAAPCLVAHPADDRDPDAGGARPAPAAGARSRHVRARAHRRPRRLSRQAGAQARARAAAARVRRSCRAWASSRPTRSARVLRAMVDLDEVTARVVAVTGRRDRRPVPRASLPRSSS